jgi:hypothetical protein
MVAAIEHDGAVGSLVSGIRRSQHVQQVQGRDRGQVLAEYEDGGSGYSLVRKFIYGTYIDEPLAMIDVDTSETLYYYHHNNN